MYTFIFLTLAMSLMCSAMENIQHSRNRRSFIDFANMVSCTTGRRAFDYLGYGCYCGLGGKGKILDAVDRCCQLHDKCYGQLRKRGLCSRFALYISSYDYSCSKCASTNKDCSRGLCRCDRRAARCFKRSKYDPNMKDINKDKMC